MTSRRWRSSTLAFRERGELRLALARGSGETACPCTSGPVRTIGAPGMAIYMGAGPSVMYVNYVLAAFEQFESHQGEPSVGAA